MYSSMLLWCQIQLFGVVFGVGARILIMKSLVSASVDVQLCYIWLQIQSYRIGAIRYPIEGANVTVSYWAAQIESGSLL